MPPPATQREGGEAAFIAMWTDITTIFDLLKITSKAKLVKHQTKSKLFLMQHSCEEEETAAVDVDEDSLFGECGVVGQREQRLFSQT